MLWAYPTPKYLLNDFKKTPKKLSKEKGFLTWIQASQKLPTWSATLGVSQPFWGEGPPTILKSLMVRND